MADKDGKMKETSQYVVDYGFTSAMFPYLTTFLEYIWKWST